MRSISAASEKIRDLLAIRWVERLVFSIVLISVSVAGTLGAVHSGLISTEKSHAQAVTPSAEDAESELEATALEVADDDSSIGEDEETEDDETELAETYEIPESLRTEVEVHPVLTTIFGPSSILDSLFPPSAVLQPGYFDREQILSDFDGRIAEEFKIPDGLRDRVGFWFDIYTKYDSNRRVIHHARYPWIVYKVVDVSFIINSDTPSRLWMRRAKAEKFVKGEMEKIRTALRKVAARRSIENPNEYEAAVIDALSELDGTVRQNAARALRDLRIQTGQRDFFVEGLERSTRYLTTMERIFESHSLPVDLTRIPFVESSFNKRATSKVGASGIWQFMGNTGRKFMKIDDLIDERRSPFKATEAAARLLKENHMILHRSWPLAVTAWNHGPGGVRKASQRSGSRDIAKIIAGYRSRSFDFASSNFYSEFLAALHAERYNREVFGALPKSEHVDLRGIRLTKAVRFNDLLKVSGISEEEFLLINPELTAIARRNLLLPKGFRLHVPESSIEHLERLFAVNAAKSGRKGQT